MKEETIIRNNAENMVRILAVDDDRVSQMMLKTILEDLAYDVSIANNGVEALELLKDNIDGIDVVLMDREMPEMDGFEAVRRIKEDPAMMDIPVIMLTGSDQPDQIREGIDAGVYYYLTKPVNRQILKSVLLAATREIQQQRILKTELTKHRTSFDLISDCRFCLRTIEEAENLACFLANCFPNPQRVISGLAELLINAVEHGNLGITYADKTDFIERGTWKEEVDERLGMPEHAEKCVKVMYRRKPDEFAVKIKDEGRGFEWRKFMEIDPGRASHNHGRGIAQANMISFDRLEYNKEGNEVTAYINEESEAEIDW